jgi:ribosomal protein S18 acetylase RimI-like enzyme
MNLVEIHPCTITSFAHVLPILDTHVEAFDYATKRRIIQLTSKIIEENPQNPPILLAYHEGNVIGFVGFTPDTDDPNMTELFGEAVKHGYQGQGIGTKLLQAGIKHIENQGANQVTIKIKASIPLYVSHFYQHAGFKPSFNEDYTGASDENHTLIFTLKSNQSSPENFYSA